MKISKLLIGLFMVVIGFIFCNVSYSQDSADTIPEHPFGEYNEVLCNNIFIDHISVVRYQNHAKAYFKVSGDVLANSDIALSTEGRLKQHLSIGPEVVLEELELETIYDLTYINKCGQETFLGTIDTRKSEFPNGVLVSQDFMNEIMRPLVMEERTDILMALQNDSKLHYMEKLSVFQDMFLGDVEINTVLSEGVFPKLQAKELRSKLGRRPIDCDCTLMTTSVSTTPATRIQQATINLPPNPIFNSPTDDILGYYESRHFTEEGNWTSNANKGKYIGNEWTKGPSRHQDVWAWGRRIHRRKYTLINGQISDDGNIFFSPNRSVIQLMWICRGFNPEDIFELRRCGCTKDIFYSSRYDSRLRTSMELPNCFLCGNKGGYARAEDNAVLLLDRALGGDAELLAIGRATVESSCSHSLNREWFNNLLELAESVGQLYLEDWQLNEEILEEIQNEISAIIVDNVSDINGCDPKNETPTLIEQESESFLIEPNDVYRLALYSGGVTEVEGYTSWNGGAQISSDFHLALRGHPGYTEETSEDCCTMGFSAWSMADFPGSPNSSSDLFETVDGFFQVLSVDFPYTQFGVLWDPSCGLDYEPRIIWNSSNTDIMLSDLHENGSVECSVYDLSGRLHLRADLFELEDFNSLMHSDLGTGLYIVMLRSDSNIKSYKLYISK